MIDKYRDLYIKLLTREGFTVRRDSLDEQEFTAGYQVAGVKPVFRENLARSNLRTFVRHLQKLRNSGSTYIGGWVSGEGEDAYYEVEGSEYIYNRTTAWDLAITRHQKAIYDWSQRKSVYLESAETTKEEFAHV